MGRSENSRNRIFCRRLRMASGPRHLILRKLEDPSLIIYHPVRFFEGKTIVTNGDQTDTIRDFMARGQVLSPRSA